MLEDSKAFLENISGGQTFRNKSFSIIFDAKFYSPVDFLEEEMCRIGLGMFPDTSEPQIDVAEMAQEIETTKPNSPLDKIERMQNGELRPRFRIK